MFNFCAIPATMEIATLELSFMNPAMFQRNIKIRKAAAASLIMRSMNPKEVGVIFRDYARKIHAKAVTADPNFLRTSIACGKTKQWLEHNYPSFIDISSQQGDTKVTLDPRDPRTRIATLEKVFDTYLAKTKRVEDLRNGLVAAGETNGLAGVEREGRETPFVEVVAYVLAAFAVIVMFSVSVVYFVLVWSGKGNEDVLNLNWVFGKLGFRER